MIAPEQRLDRWERILRRCYEKDARDIRESSQKTKKLKLYLEATNQWFAARRALDVLPEDLGRKDELRRATQILDQAREELKRSFNLS